MKRSEDQIIAQTTGVALKLGGREYELKPLTMRKALAWRATLSPVLTTMLADENALDTREALREAIMKSPEQMAHAVFGYLDLSTKERESLLDEATEDQITAAFFAVMGLAFRPMMGQRRLGELMLNPELAERSASEQLSKPH